MSTRGLTIALRDYVDVVELRIRATMLASACGLGQRQQGLVAVAVTDAGVFALQHVGRSAAELRVEDDGASSRLLVVVHGAGGTGGHAETGTKVTMGWALPPEVRGVQSVIDGLDAAIADPLQPVSGEAEDERG